MDQVRRFFLQTWGQKRRRSVRANGTDKRQCPEGGNGAASPDVGSAVGSAAAGAAADLDEGAPAVQVWTGSLLDHGRPETKKWSEALSGEVGPATREVSPQVPEYLQADVHITESGVMDTKDQEIMGGGLVGVRQWFRFGDKVNPKLRHTLKKGDPLWEHMQCMASKLLGFEAELLNGFVTCYGGGMVRHVDKGCMNIIRLFWKASGDSRPMYLLFEKNGETHTLEVRSGNAVLLTAVGRGCAEEIAGGGWIYHQVLDPLCASATWAGDFHVPFHKQRAILAAFKKNTEGKNHGLVVLSQLRTALTSKTLEVMAGEQNSAVYYQSKHHLTGYLRSITADMGHTIPKGLTVEDQCALARTYKGKSSCPRNPEHKAQRVLVCAKLKLRTVQDKGGDEEALQQGLEGVEAAKQALIAAELNHAVLSVEQVQRYQEARAAQVKEAESRARAYDARQQQEAGLRNQLQQPTLAPPAPSPNLQ
eukprot:CAMPEP_0118932224 /NCGR_PEP_ID=MMETSP1169-20130426/9517_1 /TAXON_ID=36882 /ORGANISM="Pyramimonas obovata, Strain CCMP722" /LENGTH=476 /DNA_ID=CAMNT_0006874847 /DNA_START=895 /DNA_END=2322 /DNA_ORIENTATION=-